MGDDEGTLQVEYDDKNMKTKLILTHFGAKFGTSRLDEQSFFNTFLGFTPFLGSEAVHFDSPDVHTSDKILNLITIVKVYLKCDVSDGSVVNGQGQKILFQFGLGKTRGYKVFCEPETIRLNKINKSVLKTITVYVEDNNHEEVNFNGDTSTFTLKGFKM